MSEETQEGRLKIDHAYVLAEMQRLTSLLGAPNHVLAQVQVQPARAQDENGKNIEFFQVLFAFVETNKTKLVLPDGEKLRNSKIIGIPAVKGCSITDFAVTLRAYADAIIKMEEEEANVAEGELVEEDSNVDADKEDH